MKSAFNKVFVLCLIKTIASESCERSDVSYGQRLQTGIFHTYVNHRLQTCAKNCIMTTDCNSFNINKFSGICELSSNTAASKPEEVVLSNGWIQSDIKGWPKTIAGPCSNVTCPPRNKCLYTSTGETTCLITECSVPPQKPIYSIMNPVSSERGVGKSLSYACLSGFKVQGTPYITCKTDGTWTNMDFLCRVICPSGWYGFRDSCYYFSEENKSWFNAKIDCESRIPKGHLTEIADNAEYQFIFNLMTKHFYYFIGATDIEQEGQFIWSYSGNPVTFYRWSSGEPNNQGDEDCIDLRQSGWNDMICSFASRKVF